MNLINIKSTFKHLRKNKFHSLLNIFGLAVGLLLFFQLVVYISYEKGYDSSYNGADRIYRVNYDVMQDRQNVLHSAKTPDRLYRVLKEEIPEVQYCGLAYLENVLVRYGDKFYVDQPNLWVGGDFAEVFDFQMVAGEAKLNDKLTCVISESMAKQIFGNGSALGKILYINEGMPHEITGVFEDIPSNSHLHFDFFMSSQTFVHYGWMSPQGNWNGGGWWTYLKLREGASQAQLDKGLKLVAQKYLTHLAGMNRTGNFVSQPIGMVHFSSDRTGELNTSTREKTISALILIAALILVVIWMNYINLSTALARKRMNVIATFRKLGASKLSLVNLSFIEGSIINLGAIFVAIVLYFITRNFFSHIIETPINTGFVNYGKILALMLGTVVAGLVVTSLISSLPLLKVNPALLQQKKSNKNSSSQWLVGFQFFMSCFLIICSIIISKQIRFMQKSELGVDLNQVLVLKGAASTNSDSLRRQRFVAFRDDVLRDPEFISGTATMNVPGQPLRYRDNNVSLPDRRSELKQEITVGNIDDGYIETYKLKLLAGENFDINPILDTSKVLASESTIRILGFNSAAEAIDQKIRMGNRLRIIKGVVNDFHHEGLKKPAEPMIFTHEHPFEFGYYSFRIQGNPTNVLAALKPIWVKHYPNDPMDYFFSNEYFDRQYNEEKRLGRIQIVFTIFAIIVASLGLFGLISFFAQQRTKEIGIRKVNGATITDILRLVFVYFFRFEVIAFVVSCPIAWLAMTKWLEGFAYQTSMSWWIFALAGLLAMGIALVTVSFQSWKAATKNPVESLRYE